jgi:hypothetical protein
MDPESRVSLDSAYLVQFAERAMLLETRDKRSTTQMYQEISRVEILKNLVLMVSSRQSSAPLVLPRVSRIKDVIAHL